MLRAVCTESCIDSRAALSSAGSFSVGVLVLPSSTLLAFAAFVRAP